MNVAVDMVHDLPAGVSLVRSEKGLQGFRDPACAAAIWSRELPPAVSAWLAGLAADALPHGRVVLQAANVEQTVRHLCEIAQTPPCPQRDWLIADVAMLAKRFADLMNATYVRLRLQAVTTNACRKFHRDAITGRLVCTYRGTGTQFGTAKDGDDPAHIHTTQTGAPILLRGTQWFPMPDTALLHRSPPIEGTGETRLVLVLDGVFDLEGAE